ncbi:predicted protein [Naegleria gruberi]|uniref:Predicted protein n=1 Tax=Naegleria gruberi TaxID=5762 RepID=D2W128_NAEGR|nr:uncharacterized protein NAEGRDRAFT_75067 [Naegleria gruberi]EFC37288.1 predicted protein [Naegleria gruberi]|eukprot:XP_002670032.1 predicted protein [Naegleria gruberi strain NEG-M]
MHQNLGFIPIEYYDCLEFALLHIRENYFHMSRFSKEIRDNRKFKLAVIRERPADILSMSDLLSDREAILLAISQPGFGYILERASVELRLDSELQRIAEQNGSKRDDYMLWCEAWTELDIYEPEERRIVRKMLSRNGDYFEILPHMHGDCELALIAIKDDPSAIYFISDELKRDKDFILKAIKSRVGKGLKQMDKLPEYWGNDRQVLLEIGKQNYHLLQFAEYNWREDDEFVMEMIREKTIILEDIPERFKTERHLVLELVKNCGIALRVLSSDMRNDREIVLEAIKNLPSAYQFASENLKNDIEIIKTALQLSSIVFHMIPSHFKNENEFVLMALKSGLDFKQVTIEWNRDFVLQVCKIGKMPFSAIPLEFISDFEIIGTVIKNMNGRNFKYEDLPEYIRNKNILLKLIEFISPKLIIFLPPELSNDMEFLLEYVKFNGDFLLKIDRPLITVNFITNVLEVNWQTFQYTLSKNIILP